MNKLAPYAHWFLRLALASVFLYHGLTKFFSAEKLSLIMDIPMAAVYLLAVVECVAGLLLIVGRFGVDKATRVGGLLIAIVMAGAIMIHWGQWSFMCTESHPMGGIEFQVVLLLTALYLLTKGNTC